MIDNLFILSSTGELLIEKQWHGKARRNVVDLYMEHVGSTPGGRTEVKPVLAFPKFYIISVVRWDLTFLSTVTKEVDPLFVIETQHRIVDVFVDYFKKVNETILRENFSTVVQLLDEMVDGGFPFTTEPNQLKEMVLPPSLARRMFQGLTGDGSVKGKLASSALSKIPWRKANVKYVTNEIYFDLVEQLDVIIDDSGNTVSAAVFGEIKCNCRLSGMPDLTLTFSSPGLLDDASLHRCVRINRYNKERIISFVPPDGNFKLVTYRSRGGSIRMPFYIKPQIHYSKGYGKVNVMMGTKNGVDEKQADAIVVIVPFPKSTISHSLSANCGVIRFDNITKICRWEIGKLPKDKSPMMEGGVTLPRDEVPDERPTVTAEFNAKKFSASGLKVDGLAIRGVKYKPFKGVRSFTQAGRFQIRT